MPTDVICLRCLFNKNKNTATMNFLNHHMATITKLASTAVSWIATKTSGDNLLHSPRIIRNAAIGMFVCGLLMGAIYEIVPSTDTAAMARCPVYDGPTGWAHFPAGIHILSKTSTGDGKTLTPVFALVKIRGREDGGDDDNVESVWLHLLYWANSTDTRHPLRRSGPRSYCQIHLNSDEKWQVCSLEHQASSLDVLAIAVSAPAMIELQIELSCARAFISSLVAGLVAGACFGATAVLIVLWLFVILMANAYRNKILD
jgi:hypothetical protein